MGDEEIEKGYTWETEYERTWEAIQEDATGSLQPAVDDILYRAKRRKLLQRPLNVRLGMMRHLFVIVDLSLAMQEQDLHPTRQTASLKLLEHFVEEYFDHNPISQLGIITTKNGRATKVSELAGNPKRHIAVIQELVKETCAGEPSLQNSIELAADMLRHMPSHASREILIIMGSLTTCDPGDIHHTTEMLVSNNVRVSVIGLAAEICICKKLASTTGGKYRVILDESHFKDLLTVQVAPPTASVNAESSLIKMGFPHHQLQSSKEVKLAMCMCHLDSKIGPEVSSKGYYCPQCQSKYCELPVECKACSLTLVSAPHLARSYHHLFPLTPFDEEETQLTTNQRHRFCSGCQKYITDVTLYRCPRCQSIFCIDCDLYIHESLHSCPGCAGSRDTQLALDSAVSMDIT